MTKELNALRVVTIGGGTGGFTVNSGLKLYPVQPVAICTVFDSGGSTGKLKDEFGALPQGDIRRCLLALADDSEGSLRDLFNHRFTNGYSDLTKHSMGNLMLLACEQKWGPIEGIRRMSRMLHIHGEVLPVSVDNAHLCAELSDGTVIEGESAIDTRCHSDHRTIKKVFLKPEAFICREASDALESADIVVFGPGDLYTSIIPNLLVEGLAEAISRSKAKVVYVANLMTKSSETRGFSIAHFVETLLAYGLGRDQFDALLVNNASVSAELVELYAQKDNSSPVLFTEEQERELRQYAKKIVARNFLNKAGLYQQLVRHDSAMLAKCIIELGREA